VSTTRNSWNVAVQVRFASNSLLQVPRPQINKSTAAWDVGGLLHDLAGKNDWEFFATNSASADGTDLAELATLHESVLTGLRPGDYRFVALIHDRQADGYAGAEVGLSLPHPSRGGIMGPFCIEARPALHARLPPRGTRKQQPATGRVGLSGLPCAGTGTPSGTLLLMQTWICPGEKDHPLQEFRGLISRSGTPVYRLWPPVLNRDGECVLAGDAVDTGHLAPGTYRYSLIQAGGEVAGTDFTLFPGQQNGASDSQFPLPTSTPDPVREPEP
jgi:hypothetical protein